MSNTMYNLIPDYGPLEIEDLNQFLEDSKTHFNDNWSLRKDLSVGFKDFEVKRFLSKGAFGKILLVRNVNKNEYYAMKCIQKELLVQKAMHMECTKNEKYLLERLNFPFIVYLSYFFMDNSYLYFIMPYYSGKELLHHLHKRGRFDETLTRFIGAQIVLSLEYLHYLDIIYRDLKPENILYDHTGYIKITDFGCSKIVSRRTYTACGTLAYLAPEVLFNKGYGKSVDWWALGVVLYEMTSGNPPFEPGNIIQCFDNNKAKFKMPRHFSPELKHFIDNILQIDLSRRLGNMINGVNDIKNHQWFRPILWMSLLNRKLVPPYIPEVTDVSEAGTFENLDLKVARINHFKKEFEDF